MEIEKTLHVTERKAWRRWLSKNYDKEKSVWLIYHKKHTGKPKIPYNDAVEEALCFGWIDSTVKRVDKDTTAQRFTPRKPKSSYSQMNIERLREMARQKKVIPSVLKKIKPLLKEMFAISPDILKRIKANRQAWENFRRFPGTYVRIRIGYIDDARIRPEEFEKRLSNFIKKTANNRKFGYGGTEKYFEK
jgi:uncharacterized protein YdeI (YjbR/CyaY-like superfamily)